MKFIIWHLCLISACYKFISGNDSSNEQGPPRDIIDVPLGRITGFPQFSTNGKKFYSFLSIPYAKPPTGEFRFKDPVPLEQWMNDVDGLKEPPPCAQYDILAFLTKESKEFIGQEDCLYINIHTPETYNSSSASLPVIVFQNDNAFATGAANQMQPHKIMNEDVVLVVPQYRLGVLSYLSTEDMTVSGNFGLKDQTLALRWIQNNIKYFGGDKYLVTLMGHATGAATAHLQILSHYTIGLYTRAILQSGTAMCPWALGKDHRRIAFDIGEKLGCKVKDDGVKHIPNKSAESKGENQDSENDEVQKSENATTVLMKCLQNANAKDLTISGLDYYKWTLLPVLIGPYDDANYFVRSPELILKDGKHKKLDIMFGVSKDEGAMVAAPLLSCKNWQDSLKNKFSTYGPISLSLGHWDNEPEKIAQAVYDHYVGRELDPVQHIQALNQLYGDRHQAIPADISALIHSESNKLRQKKVFMYEYSHKGPKSLIDMFNPGHQAKDWVCHGDILPHLLSMKDQEEINDEQEEMDSLILKLWVNFARTGNPTPDDSLGFQWEPFTPQNPKHLDLNLKPTMQDDKRQENRDFWKTLPTRQNLLFYGEQNYKGEERIKEEL